MKNRLVLTLSLAVAGLLSTVARAQDQQTEAVVTAVSGSVTIKLANGTSTQATPGMKLPQGANVVTGAGAQASIQTHEGINAVVGEKTDVTLTTLSVSANGTRNAEIGLKSGSIASSLDPAKKSSNNYGVRTAKGVAAARGTNYSVTLNGQNVTIAVGSGSVGAGGVFIPAGSVQYTPAGATAPVVVTLAALVASEPALATNAVSLIATAVASNSTATSANVAEVVQTLAAAAGSGAGATAVVAAASASASATLASKPGNDAAAVAAITNTIANAAVAGAVTAGNTQGAGAIVTSTAVAVVTATSSTTTSAADVKTQAAALATTVANNVNGTTGTGGALANSNTIINVSQITTNVNNATITNIGTAPTVVTTTTQTTNIVQTTPTGSTTTTSQAVITTPPTQIVDPGVISRSN